MIKNTVRPDNSLWKIDPDQQPPILGQDSVQSIERKAIDLTNQLRQCYNLPALTPNWQLSRVARLKAEDMRDNNYKVHISPIYGPLLDMIRSFGISFQRAAENIAGGQATPEEVITAWINQSSHLGNILSSQVNQIGIGYAQGGTYRHYWSQMFID